MKSPSFARGADFETPTAHSGTTDITDVRVIPMTETPVVIENGYVTVIDGRIHAFGEMADYQAPGPGCERISKPQHTVLPGLINSHMHFHMHREASPLAPPGPVALDALRSTRSALNCLREGVTVARELGHDDQVRTTLREAVRTGLIVGPRIVTAGAAIGFSYGHGSFVAANVRTLDELVDRIRREIDEGADLIKIIASNEDLANPPGDELAVPWFSAKAIEVAVETAHEAGVPISAHANGKITIERAITAGVDTIEHGIYIDESLAAGMREKGVSLVPTLSGYFENSRKFWERWWQPRYHDLWIAHRESIGFAVDAGVNIATGTDTIGTMPAEIEILRRFGGMSPYDSLASATVNGARVVGLEATAGQIDMSRPADLTIVDGNPIHDASSLFAVTDVFLRGVRYTRDELDRFVPPSARFIDRWDQPAHSCMP